MRFFFLLWKHTSVWLVNLIFPIIGVWWASCEQNPFWQYVYRNGLNIYCIFDHSTWNVLAQSSHFLLSLPWSIHSIVTVVSGILIGKRLGATRHWNFHFLIFLYFTLSSLPMLLLQYGKNQVNCKKKIFFYKESFRKTFELTQQLFL